MENATMQHIPMCVMCGENEVGTFQAHDYFCGDMCADRAHDAFEVEKFYAGWTEDEADYFETWRDEQVQEDAPMYPHDLDGFDYPEFDG